MARVAKADLFKHDLARKHLKAQKAHAVPALFALGPTTLLLRIPFLARQRSGLGLDRFVCWVEVFLLTRRRWSGSGGRFRGVGWVPRPRSISSGSKSGRRLPSSTTRSRSPHSGPTCHGLCSRAGCVIADVAINVSTAHNTLQRHQLDL